MSIDRICFHFYFFQPLTEKYFLCHYEKIQRSFFLAKNDFKKNIQYDKLNIRCITSYQRNINLKRFRSVVPVSYY